MPRRTKYWQCLVLALLVITASRTDCEPLLATAVAPFKPYCSSASISDTSP